MAHHTLLLQLTKVMETFVSSRRRVMRYEFTKMIIRFPNMITTSKNDYRIKILKIKYARPHIIIILLVTVKPWLVVWAKVPRCFRAVCSSGIVIGVVPPVLMLSALLCHLCSVGEAESPICNTVRICSTFLN